MKQFLILCLFFSPLLWRGAAGEVFSQSVQDSVAIKQTALNYILGWQYADTAQIRSAIHPSLIKRRLWCAADSTSCIKEMTANELIVLTAKKAEKQKNATIKSDIDTFITNTIESIHKDIASVTLQTTDYVDYLHLVKTIEGEWKIINILWSFKGTK